MLYITPVLLITDTITPAKTDTEKKSIKCNLLLSYRDSFITITILLQHLSYITSTTPNTLTFITITVTNTTTISKAITRYYGIIYFLYTF